MTNAEQQGSGVRGLGVQAQPVAGVCHICGCTDDHACPGGCSWIDDQHNICSACDQIMTRGRNLDQVVTKMWTCQRLDYFEGFIARHTTDAEQWRLKAAWDAGFRLGLHIHSPGLARAIALQCIQGQETPPTAHGPEPREGSQGPRAHSPEPTAHVHSGSLSGRDVLEWGPLAVRYTDGRLVIDLGGCGQLELSCGRLSRLPFVARVEAGCRHYPIRVQAVATIRSADLRLVSRRDPPLVSIGPGQYAVAYDGDDDDEGNDEDDQAGGLRARYVAADEPMAPLPAGPFARSRVRSIINDTERLCAAATDKLRRAIAAYGRNAGQ